VDAGGGAGGGGAEVGVIIRRAAAGDRPALAAALASDGTFRDDEVAVALELIDASLAGSVDYELLVADVEGAGEATGYVCFGPTPMTRSTFDLYWVVVHAAARGKGVAGALIGAMEDALAGRGGGQVRVETSETEGYGAARRLYDKLGYPEQARFDDFYAPGDALIVYYKRIAAAPP
jgi:ribosomal protein S18 acetylase RimI-like enzyme